MNYFIATIVAMVYKNLLAVVAAAIVLSAGSLAILLVAYALSSESHFHGILAVGIPALVLVVLLVLIVSMIETEWALDTLEQNSSEFRARITFFAFIWVCFNALVWLGILTIPE